MSQSRRQIGIVAAAVSEDLREAPRIARRMGFAGLLIDAVWPGQALWDLSTSGRRDLRHALAAQDQQLVGLRIDAGQKGLLSAAEVDRVLARLDRSMETAVGLGCRLLCADIGPLPPAPNRPKPRPAITPQQAGRIILPSEAVAPPPLAPAELSPADQAAWGQVDGALAELGRRADRYAVSVAFRSELAGFASLERAMAAAGCPWFGVDLDPVSLLRDEWAADELFSRLGASIRPRSRPRCDARRGSENAAVDAGAREHAMGGVAGRAGCGRLPRVDQRGSDGTGRPRGGCGGGAEAPERGVMAGALPLAFAGAVHDSMCGPRSDVPQSIADGTSSVTHAQFARRG